MSDERLRRILEQEERLRAAERERQARQDKERARDEAKFTEAVRRHQEEKAEQLRRDQEHSEWIEVVTGKISSTFELLRKHPEIAPYPSRVRTERQNHYGSPRARVILEWGHKFGLTPEEEKFRKWFSRRRRSFPNRFPERILHDDSTDFQAAIWTDGNVVFGSADYDVGQELEREGRVMRIDTFLGDPKVIDPVLARMLVFTSGPQKHYLERRYNYYGHVDKPPTTLWAGG